MEINKISENAKKIAKQVGQEAKKMGGITKFTALIQKENASIKRQYYLLGKKYYMMFAETPDLELIKFIDEIKTSNKKIEDFKAEIENIKQAPPSPDTQEGSDEVEEQTQPEQSQDEQ